MHDIFQHQLSNAYNQYLSNYILGTPYNKVILRGGKQRPATTAALHEAVRYYQSLEKTTDRKGWTIEWESWKSKKLGTQKSLQKHSVIFYNKSPFCGSGWQKNLSGYWSLKKNGRGCLL